VTFVTGHEDPAKPGTQTNWAALAKLGGTIVLYMGVKTLRSIADALIEGGMPAEIPAAAIQWGTLPKQRTVVATLDTLAAKAEEQNLTAPVVTVIGWSVVLRDELNWFEQRPLFGKRIVVTRATQQAPLLSEKLRDLGADVIEMPATQIARLDLSPLRSAIGSITNYDWLISTRPERGRDFLGAASWCRPRCPRAGRSENRRRRPRDRGSASGAWDHRRSDSKALRR